jgi:protein-tyrosine phosphatase
MRQSYVILGIMLDATRLAPRLWIGSKPPLGETVAEAGFDMLVLCAEEFQPKLASFPGLIYVVHAPFDDGPLTEEATDMAVTAALDVYDHLLDHGRALVTCMAGRNRSGLVCAIALHLLSGCDPRHAAIHIKRKRVGIDGGEALANPHFIEFLKTFKLAS